MAIRSSDLRGMLDDAWDDTEQSTKTLRDELRFKERNARALISGGSVASTSQNSRNISFAIQGPGVITPAEIVDAWRQLVDLFDRAYARLTGPTDETVYAEMMVDPLLNEVTESYNDYSELRCAR